MVANPNTADPLAKATFGATQIAAPGAAFISNMATTIRFREHEAFHRAALHMGIAGFLAGLAAHVVGLLFPSFGSMVGPWSLAAVMTAAAYGATAPDRRNRVTELAVLAGALLAVGVALGLARNGGREGVFGAGLFAGIFGALLARGARGRQAILIAACGTVFALIARYVFVKLAGAGMQAGLPPWAVAAVAGGAFSIVALMGLVPRHLELGRNRVQEAWDGCRSSLAGEVHDLAERGVSLWRQVEETVPEETRERKAIEESVLRLLDVAKRWQSVEAEGGRVPADGLAERMEQIADKVTKSTDPIAKAQYERAHAALAEQLRYVKEIGTARERVIARMHHYLAAMERLRFALINHRSADASRVSTDVGPILEDLQHLGKEIDFASEAAMEMEQEVEKEQDASAKTGENTRPTAQA